jgi:hypothetical protein
VFHGELGAGLGAEVEMEQGRSSEWSWAEGWVQSFAVFLGLVLAMSVVLCGMAAKLTGNWLSKKETEADRWRELKKLK